MTCRYSYYRTAPPSRDWRTDSDNGFDLSKANFGGHWYDGPRGSVGVSKFAAEMYAWLCGWQLPRLRGGQAWPNSGTNFIDSTYCFPERLEGEGGAGSNGSNPADNVFWGRREEEGGAALAQVREELEATREELRELRGVMDDVLAALRAKL